MLLALLDTGGCHKAQHLLHYNTVSQMYRKSVLQPTIHVIPAKKLCAAWHDFEGEALPSINTVVPLAVTAACHMTGSLGCSGGAGGGCRRNQI